MSKEKKGFDPAKTTGTTSSAGSSAGSGMARLAGFQDDTRLKANVKLFTTLDNIGESEDTRLAAVGEQDATTLEALSGGNDSRNHSSRNSAANRFMRMERVFKDVVFKVNHVVLKEQAVSVLFFHLVLFFSFL